MVINGLDSTNRKNILEICREQGIYLDAPCNGNGTCGKCRVRMTEGATEPCEVEKKFLTEQEMKNGIRLACKSIPRENCVVEFPEDRAETMEIHTGFYQERVAAGSKNKGVQTAYGVAVDIGTTTLAAVLIESDTGKQDKTAVSVNHQRIYGADVISRIQAACYGNAEELRHCIQNDITELIRRLMESVDNNIHISRVAIAGNTTMLHILQGFSCEGLGKAPFRVVDNSLQKKNWKEVFENDFLSAEVVILPGISSFVGADITAGIYSSGMYQESEKTVMLLDIGTNGEMVLGNKKHLLASSVAAGPAFEGGNISCGMPKIAGAVTQAMLYGKQHMVVKTMGKEPPKGICGTGIIDVMYELVRHRMVDENGVLVKEWFKEGFLVDGKTIRFTQEDIRQVQMAKAAIRAGIECLAQKYGVTLAEIDTVYIAGGFGFHLDEMKAIGIGLLPEAFRGKITAIGNSSLEGAKRVLSDTTAEDKMRQIAADTEEINLAESSDFHDLYIKNMLFSRG